MILNHIPDDVNLKDIYVLYTKIRQADRLERRVSNTGIDKIIHNVITQGTATSIKEHKCDDQIAKLSARRNNQ